MTFFATPERRRWTDGELELDPLTFRFDPYQLGRRLSPSSLNMADLLVKALAAVAGVFLVMYGVALLVGLVLARSITRGIHELSQGTERLRQGDFLHPIRVTSRDQLGDLAESFNVMAESVRDLLREQADKERLEEELRIARKIQMSLLPAGHGDPARAARGRALPARGRGGRRLLRPAAALGHPHGGADRGRLGQGHVGGAVHGGAEGAGAVPVADLRVAGAAARGGQPHPGREHGPALVHHHDLRGGGHRQAHDDLRPRRAQSAHPPEQGRDPGADPGRARPRHGPRGALRGDPPGGGSAAGRAATCSCSSPTASRRR